MTPDEYCQQKAAASGSSFYYSFLFLPPERRRAITAVYAYCREVDDVVDEVTDPAVAQAKLDWWRGEVEALFHGRPTSPGNAGPAALHCGNVRHHAGKAGRHHRRHGHGPATEPFPRLRSVAALCASGRGCRRRNVGGDLRLSPSATLEYADRLGIALQLINVIRDVGEDARRGRVYLPLDELQQFGVKVATFCTDAHVGGFVPMMQFQAERARALVPRSAGAAAGGGSQGPAHRIDHGRDLLDAARRDRTRRLPVLHQRIALTPLRKLWIAWKTWVST